MAALRLSHAWGSQRGGSSRGAVFVEESLIAYPVGKTVVLYSTDSRAQTFLSDGAQANALALTRARYGESCAGSSESLVEDRVVDMLATH
eukprot:1715561-Pleurochrysis_carterae.AAC.4